MSNPIGNFMKTPVHSISSEETIWRASQKMHEHQIGSLLVTDNGEYVGILTKTDLIYKVVEKGLEPRQTRVMDIMTQPVLSMDDQASAVEARDFMIDRNIQRLAVTRNGEIVGILSVKDLMSCLG